jgi:hypothetical protein
LTFISEDLTENNNYTFMANPPNHTNIAVQNTSYQLPQPEIFNQYPYETNKDMGPSVPVFASVQTLQTTPNLLHQFNFLVHPNPTPCNTLSNQPLNNLLGIKY